MTVRTMPPRVVLLLLATFGIVVALSLSVVASVRGYAHRETTARLESTARGAATAINQATPRFTLLLHLAATSPNVVKMFETRKVPEDTLEAFKELTPGANTVTAFSLRGGVLQSTLGTTHAVPASIIRRREYFTGALAARGVPFVSDALVSALPDRPLLTPISVAVESHGRAVGILVVERASVTQATAVAVAGKGTGLRVQVIDRHGNLVADSSTPPPGSHYVHAGSPPRGALAWTQSLSSIPGWRVRVLWDSGSAYHDLYDLETLIAILSSIAGLLLLFHGFLLFFQNRRAEAHLVALNEDLRLRNEELGQFNRAASHDLQTPLRAVSQNAGRLVAMLEREGVTGRTMDVAQRIEHVAVRCINMVEGLRLYSHVRESKTLIANVDIDGALAESLEDLEGLLRTSGGRVEHLDALGVVRADPTRIRRLIVNLVGNGLKYHREGVAPVVTVSPASAPIGFIGVRVQDNGIGIDPADGEVIFQPFNRLHTDEEFEGNGLGLSLARRIAERSGGTVVLDPPPVGGVGSSFTFTLPEAHR